MNIPSVCPFCQGVLEKDEYTNDEAPGDNQCFILDCQSCHFYFDYDWDVLWECFFYNHQLLVHDLHISHVTYIDKPGMQTHSSVYDKKTNSFLKIAFDLNDFFQMINMDYIQNLLILQ